MRKKQTGFILITCQSLLNQDAIRDSLLLKSAVLYEWCVWHLLFPFRSSKERQSDCMICLPELHPGLGGYPSRLGCAHERGVIALGLIRVCLGERGNREVERLV